METAKTIFIIALVILVIGLVTHKPPKENFVRVCRIYHNNGKVTTLNVSGTYYGSYSNPSSPIESIECKAF